MTEGPWALYVGRFQPFHRGHVHAVRYILDIENGVVIAIGSCMNSHELRNPFTFGERLRMIIGALDDLGISRRRWYAVGVPDVEFHPAWVQLVKALSLPFYRVYSNDPLTKVLFEETDYEVRNIPFLKKEQYSGTEIRRRMLANEDWSDLVPEATIKVIREIDGEARVRKLCVNANGTCSKTTEKH